MQHSVSIYIVLISSSFVILSIFIRKLITYCSLIPYRLVLIVISVLLTYIMSLFEFSTHYHYNHISPSNILLIVHPIIILKIVYDMDMDLFMRALPQICVLSTLGVLIYCVLMGSIVLIYDRSDRYVIVPLFGFAIAAIDDLDIIEGLQEFENLKYILISLQGESVLGTVVCMTCIEICIGTVDGYVTQWYQYVSILLRHFGGAILVGLLIGKLMSSVIQHFYNNAHHLAMVIVSISFATYYICERMFFVSGPLATFIIAAWLSNKRSRMLSEVDFILQMTLKSLFTVVEPIVYLVVASSSFLTTFKHFYSGDPLEFVGTYVTGLIARSISLITMFPLLTTVGRGMDLKTVLTMVWLPQKGVIQLMLFLRLYRHEKAYKLMSDYAAHTLFLISFSILLNGSTTKYFLRIFGLATISLERQRNMRKCLNFITAKKNRHIATLRLSNNLSQVNWQIVDKHTQILNPYAKNYLESNVRTYMTCTRQAYCDDCHKQVVIPPTNKELAGMTAAAKYRALQVQKVSIVRQCEFGLTTFPVMNSLLVKIEAAKDTADVSLNVEDLVRKLQNKSWYDKIKLYFNSFNISRTYSRPRSWYRALCYNICMNKYYELAVFTYILVVFISRWSNVNANSHRFVTACVLTVDFGLKVCAYSHLHAKSGLKLYFMSYMNILDFIIFCSTIIDVLLIPITRGPVKLTNEFYYDITLVSVGTLEMLYVLRLFKIILVLYLFRSDVVKLCDRQIGAKYMLCYDAALAVKTCGEDVLQMLPSIIEYPKIRDDIRARLTEDKRICMDIMDFIQMDMPRTSATLKTKLAIQTVLYNMRNLIDDMRSTGLIDEYELDKLAFAHYACHKNLLSFKRVPHNSPETAFLELPWLNASSEIAEYLYFQSVPVKWSRMQKICGTGFVAPGVYLITEGCVASQYVPPEITRLTEIGALPVKDYIVDDNFEEQSVDLIIPGNTIGELSVLTGRIYNCNAVCHTDVKGYYIPSFLINQLQILESSPIHGIKCSIWKHISMNLARYLLAKMPAYRTMSTEVFLLYLQKAFVPNLDGRSYFDATDRVESMVLIEGKVMETNTKEVFIAPCCLPKSVQRLSLKICKGVNVKLFVVPLNESDANLICSVQERFH